MAEKKLDIEAEKQRLSEMFEQEAEDFTEDFEDFADDADIIDAEFQEEISEPEIEKIDAKNDREVIHGEVVEENKRTELYLQFLESIPKDEDVTIVVNRYADKNLAGQFRVPCSVFGVKLSLYWSGENNPEELYPEVQKEIGGGRYLFQIREKGRGFSGKSWTAIVHDAPEPSKLELTLTAGRKAKNDEHKRNNESSQPFVISQPSEPHNSIDDLLENIEKIERLRSILAPPTDAPVINPATAESSFEDRIIMKVLERTTDNPRLEEKVVNAVFGIVEKKENKQEGFIDLAKHALSNPEQVKGFVGMIADSFGGIIGALMTQKKPGNSQIIVPGHSQTNQPSGLEMFRAAPKVEVKPQPTIEEKQPDAPQMTVAPIPIIKLED